MGGGRERDNQKTDKTPNGISKQPKKDIFDKECKECLFKISLF